MEFSPDGRFLSTVVVGNAVQVIDLESGSSVLDRPLNLVNYDWGPVVSLDGQILLYLARPGSLEVTDLLTGGRTWRVDCPSEPFSVACMDHDSFAVVRDLNTPALSVHELKSGRTIRQIPLKRGFINGYGVAAVSSDGRRVLVSCLSGPRINGWTIVDLWDAASPVVWSGRDVPMNEITYHARFSEDGRLVATCGAGQVVEVWDSATADRVAILPGYESATLAVDFSPDGKTLAAADARGVIKLWNVATWRELFTLTQLNRPVRCLRFSPDGRTLAAASDPPGPGAPSRLTFWHAEVSRGRGEAGSTLNTSD